ncbi:MAG: FAD-dependent oxidoreductase [Cyanobacteria bacterium PR.3.49]|jgi:NADH dehydrogenase|nr:FAD-dependent oxidoreductase [Cyanobacteria bacterium PR.3.49]
MAQAAGKRPHVVILGGGFGGLAAAQTLKNADVDVTVVDKTNYHLFQPLLYQVAMAGLSAGDIAHPIRSILRQQKNTEVILAEVTKVDLKANLIHTSVGEINYDYLILAAGAQTNYFGHNDWPDFAVGLKDIDDALEIRRRVLVAFEDAESEKDTVKQKQMLTFVVIGGGPTGVELAGSLAELARHSLVRDFRHINPSSAQIILLEGLPRVLPPFVEELSAKAAEQLKRIGVEVRTGVKVTNINECGVHVEGGEIIPSSTVMWCAGVAAVPLTKTMDVNLDRGGRVIVEPDLSIPNFKNAFAIGDVSNFAHQGEKPLPGLAPVAMQQGEAAARSILDDLSGRTRRKFHYTDKGTMATIGRSAAVADLGKLKLSGLPAWLAWLLIHILMLIGFRNRAVVFLNWLWSFFTYDRGSRLITGHRMEAGCPIDLRQKVKTETK